MTYGEARAFLAGCRPGEIKPGLERMQKVLKLSGQTLDRQAYIHVAGTNGKGSTAAMIAGILTAAGKRVGLYSSPAVTGPAGYHHYRRAAHRRGTVCRAGAEAFPVADGNGGGGPLVRV